MTIRLPASILLLAALPALAQTGGEKDPGKKVDGDNHVEFEEERPEEVPLPAPSVPAGSVPSVGGGGGGSSGSGSSPSVARREPPPVEESEEFLDASRLEIQAWWDGPLTIRVAGTTTLPDGACLSLRVLRGGRPTGIQGQAAVSGGRYAAGLDLRGRIPVTRYRVEATFDLEEQSDPRIGRLARNAGPARVQARASIGSDDPAEVDRDWIDWRVRLQPLVFRQEALVAEIDRMFAEAQGDTFDASRWTDSIEAVHRGLHQAHEDLASQRGAWLILPDAPSFDRVAEANVRLLDATWFATREVFAARGFEGADRLPMPPYWVRRGSPEPAAAVVFAARRALEMARGRMEVREFADLEREILRWAAGAGEGAVAEMDELRTRAGRSDEAFTVEGWNERAANWSARVRDRADWYRSVVEELARQRPEANAAPDREAALAAGQRALRSVDAYQKSATRAILEERKLPLPPTVADAPPLPDVQRSLREALRELEAAAR